MTSTKDTNPKDAVGCRKPPLSTIPCPVLFEVGTAMLEGACKYRRHNYRVAGVRASIYYDAAMRHLMQWWEGEDFDRDSGVHHVSKAIAGLMVLRDAMMRDMVYDDRPPKFENDPGREPWMSWQRELTEDVLDRYPSPEPPYTINSKIEEIQKPPERITVSVRSLNKGDRFRMDSGEYSVERHIPEFDRVRVVDVDSLHDLWLDGSTRVELIVDQPDEEVA